MKLIFLLTLLLSPALVSFSQIAETSKKTQILFVNRKYGNKQFKAEVMKRVIEPLLKESAKPIKEIIVDFCPEDAFPKVIGRGCGSRSERAIIIVVNGFPTVNADTAFSIYARVEINKDGSLAKDEYKRLLPENRRASLSYPL